MTTQNQIYQLFNNSGCLTFATIRRYLEKQLPERELRMVEEHLIDCPLCSDAVDGFSNSKNLQQSEKDIHAIVNEIQARTPNETTAGDAGLKTIQRRRYLLSAAASVVLLLGTYLLYYYWNTPERVFSDNFETYPATEQNEESISTIDDNKQTGVVIQDSANRSLADNIKQSETREPKNEMETRPKKTESTSRKKSSNEVVTIITHDETMDDEIQLEETEFVVAEELPSEEQDKPERDLMDDWTESRTKTPHPVDDIEVQEVSKDEEVSIADNNNERFYENSKINGFNRKRQTRITDRKGNKAKAQEKNRNIFHSEANDSILQHALRQYRDQEYEKAIKNFEIVIQSVPQNSKALLYCAVSQLAINKPDEAIANLESILKSGHNLYIPAARWYIALAYLKKNDKAKAKAMLQNIVKQNGEYKREAKKALQDLK